MLRSTPSATADSRARVDVRNGFFTRVVPGGARSGSVCHALLKGPLRHPGAREVQTSGLPPDPRVATLRVARRTYFGSVNRRAIPVAVRGRGAWGHRGATRGGRCERPEVGSTPDVGLAPRIRVARGRGAPDDGLRDTAAYSGGRVRTGTVASPAFGRGPWPSRCLALPERTGGYRERQVDVVATPGALGAGPLPPTH